MSDSDHATITTGELGRAVNLIRSDINKLEEKIDHRPTNRDIAYLENRIKDLEGFQTWAMRLGIPGIFGAGLALLTNIATRLQQLGVG